MTKITGTVKQLLPAGVRMVLSGEKLLRSGEPEARLLKEFVAKGSVAIDVGANVGKYSYALSKYVGRAGRVVCIEPLEENARMIRAAGRQLRLPLDVRSCAVSSHPGRAEIRIPMLNGQLLTGLAGLDVDADLVEKRHIDVSTVDAITESISGRLSFIKIDTEGHEFSVLQGAHETLIRHRPTLLIEIEERHSHRPVEDVFNLLKDYGYGGFFLDAAKNRVPVQQFSVEIHQHRHEGYPATGEYINNFVFVHDGKGDA